MSTRKELTFVVFLIHIFAAAWGKPLLSANDFLQSVTGKRDEALHRTFEEYLALPRTPICSVYFAERMAERLAGTDGVEFELTYAARLHWKVKAKEKCDGVDGRSFVCLSFANAQSNTGIIRNMRGKRRETACSLFACHLPKWQEATLRGTF